MKLTFSGARDDLIEVRADGDISDVFSSPHARRGMFTLATPGDRVAIDGVRIHVVCEQSGCWSVGVSPIDEDSVVPTGWTFTIEPQGTSGPEPSYSAVLRVVADDDAVLTWEGER